MYRVGWIRILEEDRCVVCEFGCVVCGTGSSRCREDWLRMVIYVVGGEEMGVYLYCSEMDVWLFEGMWDMGLLRLIVYVGGCAEVKQYSDRFYILRWHRDGSPPVVLSVSICMSKMHATVCRRRDLLCVA